MFAVGDFIICVLVVVSSMLPDFASHRDDNHQGGTGQQSLSHLYAYYLWWKVLHEPE